MAHIEDEDGPAVRRPGRPAARERSLRRARVDARDDGHDPQPRAQRRDDRGPRREHGQPEVRGELPGAVRDDVPRHRRRRTSCPPTRGSSCARPSRRCSGPGTATARARTASARASPTTSARASRSRRWCSATGAWTPGPACCSPATRRRASPTCTATCCSTPRARTSSRAPTRPSRSPSSTSGCPAVGRELREYARRLERHHRDLCDIEFTIEHGRLWMLQCRVGKRSPQAALRIAVDMAEDPAFPLTRAEAVRRVASILADPPRRVVGREAAGPALTVGLPASPGRRRGGDRADARGGGRGGRCGPDRDPRARRDLARRRPRHGARGGRAHRDGRAREPRGRRRARLGDPGGRRRRGGRGRRRVGRDRGPLVPGGRADHDRRLDRRGVRGRRRRAARRSCPRRRRCSPGRARPGSTSRRRRVRWRRGRRPRRRVASAAPRRARPAAGALADDDVVRVLAVKGYATPETAAVAAGGSVADASAVVDALVARGLAEPAAGQFRLTAEGQDVAAGLFAEDTAAWGVDRANAALDAFIALDQRMKATVTAWQMRDVDGTQTFNDHSDPAYDAAVLADLAALDADVRAWLDPEVPRLPRLGPYLDRLARRERGGAGRRRAVRRVTPRRQLPRRLVRAPRGPHPPRRPHPRRRGRLRPGLSRCSTTTARRSTAPRPGCGPGRTSSPSSSAGPSPTGSRRRPRTSTCSSSSTTPSGSDGSRPATSPSSISRAPRTRAATSTASTRRSRSCATWRNAAARRRGSRSTAVQIAWSRIDGLEDAIHAAARYPVEGRDDRIRSFHAQLEYWQWLFGEGVRSENRLRPGAGRARTSCCSRAG